MVNDEDLQITLEKEKDLEQANRVLIDKANQGGGRDNITAILVRVDDAKLSSSTVQAALLPAKA
jgi:protein phosphatase